MPAYNKNGSSCLSSPAGTLSPVAASPMKLKRLPHIFCKMLELPFHSETPVQIRETKDCYVFLIQQPGLEAEDVRAEIIEIVPGSTKIVMRGAERVRAALMQDAEVHPWRFRLPAFTLPEAASAAYSDGILTVTIPKISSASLTGDPRSGTMSEK